MLFWDSTEFNLFCLLFDGLWCFEDGDHTQMYFSSLSNPASVAKHFKQCLINSWDVNKSWMMIQDHYTGMLSSSFLASFHPASKLTLSFEDRFVTSVAADVIINAMQVATQSIQGCEIWMWSHRPRAGLTSDAGPALPSCSFLVENSALDCAEHPHHSFMSKTAEQ